MVGKPRFVLRIPGSSPFAYFWKQAASYTPPPTSCFSVSPDDRGSKAREIRGPCRAKSRDSVAVDLCLNCCHSSKLNRGVMTRHGPRLAGTSCPWPGTRSNFLFPNDNVSPDEATEGCRDPGSMLYSTPRFRCRWPPNYKPLLTRPATWHYVLFCNDLIVA